MNKPKMEPSNADGEKSQRITPYALQILLPVALIPLLAIQVLTLMQVYLLYRNGLQPAAPFSTFWQFLFFNLGALILVMLTTGVDLWLSIRKLLRPITHLSESARRVAAGEWNLFVEESERSDEIGTLAKAINEIAGKEKNLVHSKISSSELRTQNIRTATEIIQNATAASHVTGLLHTFTQEIATRFEFYNTAIFLIDETGVYATLVESAGSEGHHREVLKIPADSKSLVGWVAANNEARTANDVSTDPLFTMDPSLPDTQSEAAIPITFRENLIGVLDIQSTEPGAFNAEDILLFQSMANLLAGAYRNLQLFEGTRINLEESSLLNQTSRKINQAQTEEDIYQAISFALGKSSYIYCFLVTRNNKLRVKSINSGNLQVMNRLSIEKPEIQEFIPQQELYRIIDADSEQDIPPVLQEFFTEWMVDRAAFLPIRSGATPEALVILSSYDPEGITPAFIQPYINLVDLASTAVTKLHAQAGIRAQLEELEMIGDVVEAVTAQTELEELFKVVHRNINLAMGEVNLLIALYDAETNMISIPYLYEGEDVVKIDPFPLGQGLTTILIQTKKPLLLNDIDEEQLLKLGARLVGQPAKSWLGVPLLVAGEPTGAIVVQDLYQGDRFTPTHERLLSNMAAQVAVAIRNALLLTQTRQMADRERALHELAGKIRGSSSIEKILETTATEVGKKLGARRARIEISVPTGESHGNNGSKEKVS